MISGEQLELANELKKTHLWLRKRTQEVGGEQAWQEHLTHENVLQKYSVCMKQLAENYWSHNNKGERHSFCRIQWVINVLKKYFNLPLEIRAINSSGLSESKMNIKLLDVGSCYDPFRKFDCLDTTAIDLYPASDSVIRCNFLNLIVEPNSTENVQTLLLRNSLPGNYFDAVVFCLFLEYLPMAKQRLDACKIAWNVLKERGLLLIITPDSKHESANSALMKKWKQTLATLGFARTHLTKLRYLYCMAFMKVECPIQNHSDYDHYSLPIPQDEHDYLSNTECHLTRENDCDVAEAFDLLPNFDLLLD